MPFGPPVRETTDVFDPKHTTWLFTALAMGVGYTLTEKVKFEFIHVVILSVIIKLYVTI